MVNQRSLLTHTLCTSGTTCGSRAEPTEVVLCPTLRTDIGTEYRVVEQMTHRGTPLEIVDAELRVLVALRVLKGDFGMSAPAMDRIDLLLDKRLNLTHGVTVIVLRPPDTHLPR